MKRLLPFLLLFLYAGAFAQPVEMQVFVASGSTAAATKLGVRMRSTAGIIPYQGVTFYILYNNANATYLSVEDNKLVTTYRWGTGNRTINNLPVNLMAGGQTYNRRYQYLNSDENTGTSDASIINLTTSWDTLITITFNNLQGSPVFGGYAYAQKTSEAQAVALTDPLFLNIPINVTTSSVALSPNAGPLPVLLTKFNAQCQPDKTTRVTWTTTQELDNKYFEVEKSTNGNTWSAVSKVAANGNSATEKNYQITDPEGGVAHYRLKQVDRDGKVTYSTIIKTSCDGRNVYVTLYPVPARDVLTLVVGSDKAVKTNLQVYDNEGRMVVNTPVSITAGTNNFRIAVHNLAAGEYILRSSDASFEVNKRFTIVR